MKRWRAALTRTVIVLGTVSFFTDISSEMINPIRLIFLVQVLGTPLLLAALIEGLAESATALLKIFAGRVADRVSRRTPLLLWGYGLSNMSKPLLALTTGWIQALGIVLIDRTGKSLRGSPRDAMIADSTNPANHGLAFGFHRSMDTFGAAIGPLLTALILLLTQSNLRAVFAWTAVPGIAAILLILFLRETAQARETKRASHKKIQGSRIQATLGRPFWLFTAVVVCFSLGNSSDALLFLRSEGLQQSLEAVPLLYFGFNLVYAVLATPLGALSDRWGCLPVLIGGYTAFALVYAGWALANQPWHAWALFCLYGVYYAATEGVARAFVTQLIAKEQRGTALGWFTGLTSAAALPANLIGGWLWSLWGPGASFGYSAWLAGIAVGLLIAWAPWLRRAPDPETIAPSSAKLWVT